MFKRILPTILALFICISVLPALAVAAEPAAVGATYKDGIVTVVGSNFNGGEEYTLRVVNQKTSSIVAMGQTVSDPAGGISASITTGPLGTLSDYKFYVNRQDGSLAVQSNINLSQGGGGESPGGGNSSGPGNQGGDKEEIQITVDGNIVKVAIKGTVDPATGKVIVNITPEAAANLIGNVKKLEAQGRSATVEINVNASSSDEPVQIVFPREALNELSRDTMANLKINAGIGSIVFDTKAVKNMNAGPAGDIRLEVKKTDNVMDRPAYDFSLMAGSSPLSKLQEGKAIISIPYTLRPGEDANAIVVNQIDEANGTMKTVRGVYNAGTGTVDFAINQLSKYAIVHNKVIFTDVAAEAWYNRAITFTAARGIVLGTGDNKFSPDAPLTRGQFIVMLMRAYGVSPEENPADNFDDAGNTYYSNYLAAAKRNHITLGVGNNKFAPELEISREEMFTLLYRAMEVLDEDMTSDTPGALSNFSDAGEISRYAQDAMNKFVSSGVVAGSYGKLNPKGRSDRAQIAQVLYNIHSKVGA